MKSILLGSWMCVAIGSAINGEINPGMAVWGIAAFAGWAVLVFAEAVAQGHGESH
jgi:hypothetical protein